MNITVNLRKKDLQEEYMKAADNLTINEENRLRRKVEVLTIEKSKVDLALSQIEEYEEKDWTLVLNINIKYPLRLFFFMSCKPI